MQAYLGRYARHHDLPVGLDTAIEAVEPAEGGGFLAHTAGGTIRAGRILIATGPFDGPVLPSAAAGLDREVRQLHSSKYRRPADIPSGVVLVVGGGNSAAQLACELAATHQVPIAAPRLWYLPDKILGISLYW